MPAAVGRVPAPGGRGGRGEGLGPPKPNGAGGQLRLRLRSVEEQRPSEGAGFERWLLPSQFSPLQSVF